MSSYEQLLIPHMQLYFRLLRATRAARYPNLHVAVTNVRGIYLSSIFWTFTKNYARLELRSLFHSLFALLRLRRRLARDGFSSALWDCFGGRIFNVAANLSSKTVPQCTFTTISTDLPRNLKVANLIARILNFYHMKLSQSLALEQ